MHGSGAVKTGGRVCYRPEELARISAALQAGESLLVISETGMGKSQLAEFIQEELSQKGFPVSLVLPATPKQFLQDCAIQLGADVSGPTSKAPTISEMQNGIERALQLRPAFIIIDDAHRLPLSIRAWLQHVLDDGGHLLLLATNPLRKDIFLRLPRIELQPLSRRDVRAVLMEAAADLNVLLPPHRAAALLERCAGNPMLAHRAVREEYLGLDETSPDHVNWIDGTPFLIAGILAFSVLRFLGRGLHQTDLYLLGGFIAVTAAIARMFVFSLPRPSGRLGR